MRYHLSGQSVVTIDGKDYYLGKHDSPESLARHAVVIGIYQANGLKLPEDFDAELLDGKAAALLGALDAPSQQADQPIIVAHVTALFRMHVAEKCAGSRNDLNRNNKLCDTLEQYPVCKKYVPPMISPVKQH